MNDNTTHENEFLKNLFDKIRSQNLYRSQNRWIAGVASGIAEKIGISTTVVRGIFFVLTLIGYGSPILLYILGWLLLPDATTDKIIAQNILLPNSKTKTYTPPANDPRQAPVNTSPYSHTPKIVNVKRRPHVSGIFYLVTFSIIFAIAAITSLLVVTKVANIYMVIAAVLLITLVFVVAMIHAGSQGKKATAVTVLGTLFTTCVALPSIGFANTIPAQTLASTIEYQESQNTDQTQINSAASYVNIDLQNYKSVKADSNGEVKIEVNSIFTDLNIKTNSEAVKIVYNSNDNLIIKSTNNWSKTTDMSTWSNISKANKLLEDKVLPAGSKATFKDLKIYDKDGNLIESFDMIGPKVTSHSFDVTNSTNAIKTQNYDSDKRKYVIEVNSPFANIQVSDKEISDGLWYGYKVEDSEKPNGVAYKELFSSEKKKISVNTPLNGTQENFSAVTSDDLDINLGVQIQGNIPFDMIQTYLMDHFQDMLDFEMDPDMYDRDFDYDINGDQMQMGMPKPDAKTQGSKQGSKSQAPKGKENRNNAPQMQAPNMQQPRQQMQSGEPKQENEQMPAPQANTKDGGQH